MNIQNDVKIVSPGGSYLDHNYSVQSASRSHTSQQFQNTSEVEMSGSDSDSDDGTPYLDAFFRMNTSENYNKMIQEIASDEEKRLADSKTKCQELKAILNKAKYGLIRRMVHNKGVIKKHRNNPALKKLLSEDLDREGKEVGERSAEVEKKLKMIMELDKEKLQMRTKKIIDVCQQTGVFRAEEPDNKLASTCIYYSLYKLEKMLHPEEDLKDMQREINGLRSRRQSISRLSGKET